RDRAGASRWRKATRRLSRGAGQPPGCRQRGREREQQRGAAHGRVRGHDRSRADERGRSRRSAREADRGPAELLAIRRVAHAGGSGGRIVRGEDLTERSGGSLGPAKKQMEHETRIRSVIAAVRQRWFRQVALRTVARATLAALAPIAIALLLDWLLAPVGG